MEIEFVTRYQVEPLPGGGRRTTCIVKHVPSGVEAMAIAPEGEERWGVAERLEGEILTYLRKDRE